MNHNFLKNTNFSLTAELVKYYLKIIYLLRIKIAFIFILIINFSTAQQPNLRFEHLSVTQGLSQSEVNCICQDNKGFIWIGTLDGLNKFDGYDITVYRKKTDAPNSLSNNYILALYEDNLKNLWVGTLGGGLNKYDNASDGFISYLHDKTNPKSIASNSVSSIIQSHNGDLLIGTQLGLSIINTNRLNNDVPEFKNYFDFEVNAILEDKSGGVWLASWDGLYKIKFDETGIPKIVAHYNYEKANKNSIISNDINSLFQDREGNLWIGSNNGLDMLSSGQIAIEGNPIFTHYQNNPGNSLSLPNNEVLAIHQVENGTLLIGTRGGGLSFFNLKNRSFESCKAEKYNNNTLSNNSVKNIFEDRTGVLWIGTLGGGISKIDMLRKQFNRYEIVTNNSKQIPSNYIRAIYEDKNNLIWLGTLDGGLFTLDRNNNLYTKINGPENYIKNYKAPRNVNAEINGKNVFTIFEDIGELIWIGTNGGINILNKKTGRIAYHTMDYQNPDSLISNSVFSIAKDDDESFWIGTWGGLHHLIPAKNGRKEYFIRYTNNMTDSNSISENIIRYVYNDPLNSDIWIATMGGGLNKLIKNSSNNSVRFVHYKENIKDQGSISCNEVNMVLRTKHGDLWIATNDGLNKLTNEIQANQASFLKFKENDGLSGNHVQSLLEDSKGNLWLGTNKGLSKFNPESHEFSNFDASDGLQSDEFSEHTCFISLTGEMFFGGVNGFNSFYPDSIKKNTIKPVTEITNLLIFNQVIPVGMLADGRTILNHSISETKEIVLSYKDNVFTIEFSALHFASPEKNKYAYKMEGFDDKWLLTDAKNRKATFTNLTRGTYHFKVKASNNDGVWQDNPTVLKIVITPPFWKTWLAYFVYLFVLIALAYAIFNEVKVKERLKSEVLLKNLEQKKAEELNQMKLQFFTNITHEFRTPLTLIISPLENILGTLKGNGLIKEQLVVMHRNAKYLVSLINELMDFRKAETGSWQLSTSKNDLVAFVLEVVSTYKDIAEKRNIKLKFDTRIEQIEVWFDRDMLVKVLNNLIYNAFKFTSDGGQIEISIEKGKELENGSFSNTYEIKEEGNPIIEWVSIKVKDNGVGISSQSIKNIFNRYYQVGSNDSIKHLGSGIGLALTKNLVLLNKGEILVSSDRDKGTEFIVRLPLGNTHLTNLEIISVEQISEDKPEVVDYMGDLQNDNNSNNYTINEIDNSAAPLILVVEDNNDMRQFIKGNLERKFRVIEALNGLEGYKIALETIPDLIVSDIIMPEMGGIQLCKKLKRDVLTSHIPVVLLTALASVSNQIEGLETGADDYISKPFNYQLFEIRIENLIRSRKILRERFGKEIEIESKDFTLNWRDQEFLDKAIKLVKEQISEPELNVDNLSKDIGMSRMHLHRKMTALTDQTPSEFIRTIRLKEAARLLAENRLSISEIAYKVGFTAPSYFTTCFGKQFGISPKEYLSRFTK